MMTGLHIRTGPDLADLERESLEIHGASFHRIHPAPDGRTLDRENFLRKLRGAPGSGPVRGGPGDGPPVPGGNGAGVALRDARRREMNGQETEYALEPTTFRSMREAQGITDVLEDSLADRNLGAPNVRPELVEIFSEIVNNAAEHGMTESGASAHVRFMPHRRGSAFDVVVADEGPGIRTTMAGHPGLAEDATDSEAIMLAVQELVSGTGNPVRGIGLWMTVTEMRKPGRKLWIHSGSGLLTMYGEFAPEFRETEHRRGVMVRLTIPG